MTSAVNLLQSSNSPLPAHLPVCSSILQPTAGCFCGGGQGSAARGARSRASRHVKQIKRTKTGDCTRTWYYGKEEAVEMENKISREEAEPASIQPHVCSFFSGVEKSKVSLGLRVSLLTSICAT